MRYKLHNIKIIPIKKQRQKIKELLDEKVKRLEKFVASYPKPLKLNVYFNKISSYEYMVSFVIQLKSGVIYLKEKGKEVESLINILYDKLKIKLKKKIRKERKDYLYKRKSREVSMLKEHQQELRELRSAETWESFSRLVHLLLPDLERYIKQRIRSAQLTEAIKRGEFKFQDLLGEFYLMVYDRLDEMPENENESRIWLYQLADEMLNNKFRELEFEQKNIDHLAEIVDASFENMEESYTMDADNELMLVEELDDTGAQAQQYNVYDLLYEEDEETLVDEVTLKYNKETINKFIEKELAKLPVFKRTIMDLYLLSQMSIDEIAQIKNISEIEVEAVISEVNKNLKQKLNSLV